MDRGMFGKTLYNLASINLVLSSISGWVLLDKWNYVLTRDAEILGRLCNNLMENIFKNIIYFMKAGILN